MKVVINDPKTGKSYQKEVEKEKESQIIGHSIGDMVDGGIIGASGYKLEITGGSDLSGFPMRADLPGARRAKLLLSGGLGFRSKRKGGREKRMVAGNIINDQIYQVNTKVVETGEKPLEELVPKEEGK